MFFTEFGFRINNRKFSVRIPKLKIRAPKILQKKKDTSPPLLENEDDDSLHLRELSIRYSKYLTLKSQNQSEGRSGSLDSSENFSDLGNGSSIDSNEAQFIKDEDEQEARSSSEDVRLSGVSFSCVENFQRSSTPISLESLEQHLCSERRVIILKDVSGIKIYEDLCTENCHELVSFLEETGATVYEEFDHSSPTYENLDDFCKKRFH